MKAVNPTFLTCEVKVGYASKSAFQGSLKDQIPTHEKSNVIYLFTCRCGDRYVGKTTQRLENWIKQHLPARSTTSAIAEHLMKNSNCLDNFNKSMFSVIRKAHTESVFYAREALYIRFLKLEFCKQMDLVKRRHMI